MSTEYDLSMVANNYAGPGRGRQPRRETGEIWGRKEGRIREGPPIPLERATSPTGLMEALYLCG